VTAKWSLFDGRRGLLGGDGYEMWVTGDCEGTFCDDLKPFQYCCSGVMGEGPLGSFTCWSFVTGAAIV
jgi:hypothetical protein